MGLLWELGHLTPSGTLGKSSLAGPQSPHLQNWGTASFKDFSVNIAAPSSPHFSELPPPHHSVTSLSSPLIAALTPCHMGLIPGMAPPQSLCTGITSA